jgi:uncharacterized repeat protein (TIGR03843 family)
MPIEWNDRDQEFAATCALLRDGEIKEARGLLPWGSNYTFLMSVCRNDVETLAIYKPRRGERPLWDFPDGSLCLREMAAFVVSEALQWHIVPPTVLRDGPQGFGMLQQFVEHDPEQHYFTFDPAQRPQLQKIALFDYLANNADRKGGHCLLGADGYIWAIDHGICFHAQPKLRTVIWDFAEQAIPTQLTEDLDRFLGEDTRRRVQSALRRLLTEGEILAMYRRADSLIQAGKYPEPGPGRQYPWPPI